MKALLLLAALLAQESALKTELARGPYLQGVRPDGAIVCFWTDVECEGVVRIGNRAIRTPKGRRHYAEIGELKPATEYTYVVEAGGAASEPAAFRTTPASADAPVTFVAFGDCRSGPETHAKVVERMAKHRPEFVLSTGDLVENGADSREWDLFFRTAGPLLRAAPYYPSLGNHEANAKEYFDVFVLGGEERWYSFDWGPIHVVSIDTTVLWRRHPKQLAWLKDDLARSKAPFKIVIWHHAPYSSHEAVFRQREAEVLAQIYAPILEQGGVCLALGGHNHNYQRAEARGVTYVTTAGGGAPLYALGPALPERKAARVTHHYCLLRAEGKTLSLEAIDLEGKVFDRWSYEAK